MDITKHHFWTKHVEVTEQILHGNEASVENSSQLSSLNISHNLFTSIPVVLPCLAVNLTRLNMAFNSLRSMSHITSYPNSLKQLDLSHNQISCWPSLPQVEVQDLIEIANLTCYSNSGNFKDRLSMKGKFFLECPEILLTNRFLVCRPNRSVRSAVLNTVCTHRRHLRLDNLRTLILADNKLVRIQLTTDDDGDVSASEDEETERVRIFVKLFNGEKKINC